MARSGLNGANGNRPARPNRVKKPRPSKPPRTRPSRPPRTKRPKKTTTTATTTTTTEEPTTTTTTTSTTTTTTSTTTTSTSTTTTTTTTSSSAFDLDYEALKLEAAALDLALEAPSSGSKNNYAVDANYNNNNQQNYQQPNYQQQQYQQQNSQQNYNQGYNSYDQPKLSCWTCQASSYEECGQTGKLVACQPNQVKQYLIFSFLFYQSWCHNSKIFYPRVPAFWKFGIVVIGINNHIDNFKWVARLLMPVKICKHRIFETAIQIIPSVDLRRITIILYVDNVVTKITVPNHLPGGSQHPEKNGLMNEHVIWNHVNQHVNKSWSKRSVNLFKAAVPV